MEQNDPSRGLNGAAPQSQDRPDPNAKEANAMRRKRRLAVTLVFSLPNEGDMPSLQTPDQLLALARARFQASVEELQKDVGIVNALIVDGAPRPMTMPERKYNQMVDRDVADQLALQYVEQTVSHPAAAIGVLGSIIRQHFHFAQGVGYSNQATEDGGLVAGRAGQTATNPQKS